MTERAARDAVIAASERDIDSIFQTLRRIVSDAVRRHDGQMDALTTTLIRREIDPAFRAVFGNGPNDETAALTRIIVRRTQEVRDGVIRRASG